MSKTIKLPDRFGQAELRDCFSNIYHRLELTYWRIDDCARCLAWGPSARELEVAAAKLDRASEDVKGAYAKIVKLNHLLFPGEEKS